MHCIVGSEERDTCARMKFIVCFVLLTACAEALPGSVISNTEDGREMMKEQLRMGRKKRQAGVRINHDPAYVEDHPDGYPLTYPETGNQYGNQASVEWDICTRNNQIGKMLLFKVDYYNTERGYDFLKIYNSQTEVARLDGEYPTNFPVAMVHCTSVAGTCAKVQFKSDAFVTNRGFKINVQLVDEGIDVCQPNPCARGGECKVREDLVLHGFGVLASRGRADALEIACGYYSAHVCCLCRGGLGFYNSARDCSDSRQGGGY